MASRLSNAFKTDRRRAPRVDTNLPVTVTGQGKPFLVQTKNLSATGAYCTFRQFVSPMTKLGVRLEIAGSASPRAIRCDGIVVRVDPPKPSRTRHHYDVAIFFQGLEDDDRFALARYLQRHLRRTAASE